ncbi:hypothetical protein [Desertivirga arenae]|uniref:hypothetical protein n=1 Tax=Desertivirga arenae TaxID=2810309 RepID=UPI001A9594B1|nr:hypothetical protein [Pedobacter sp. SYSU D00823]
MPSNLTIRTCLFVLIVFNVHGQEVTSGARISSLGNTGVALQDAWSMQSNQAGIAALKDPLVAISYQNTFLETDIATQGAVFVCPFKNDAIGLGLQNYGISAYSEQKISLAYAKGFGKTVFAALCLNAHQVKIIQYGTARTYSFEAGIQFKPSPKILIGSHISNPARNSYNSEVDARIPTVLEIGAAYEISDRVIFNSGLVKDLDWMTDARFGLEYNAIQWLSFRGGISLNPFRQYAGLGCKWQKLHLDGGASSHPTLGYSPQVSMSYEF